VTVEVLLATSLADAIGGEQSLELEGGTVGEVMRNLGERHPPLARLLWREGGVLNPMLAVFRNRDDIRTLEGLATPVRPGDAVAVISALEGG
jgi:molybdopterin converting factor small subunit